MTAGGSQRPTGVIGRFGANRGAKKHRGVERSGALLFHVIRGCRDGGASRRPGGYNGKRTGKVMLLVGTGVLDGPFRKSGVFTDRIKN